MKAHKLKTAKQHIFLIQDLNLLKIKTLPSTTSDHFITVLNPARANKKQGVSQVLHRRRVVVTGNRLVCHQGGLLHMTQICVIGCQPVGKFNIFFQLNHITW